MNGPAEAYVTKISLLHKQPDQRRPEARALGRLSRQAKPTQRVLQELSVSPQNVHRLDVNGIAMETARVFNHQYGTAYSYGVEAAKRAHEGFAATDLCTLERVMMWALNHRIYTPANASTTPDEHTDDNGELATRTTTGMDEQVAEPDIGVGHKQTASEQSSTLGREGSVGRLIWSVAGHPRDDLSREMKHQN